MKFLRSLLRREDARVPGPIQTGLPFQAAKAAAQKIEGMFSDFSMAAIDSLLALQREIKTTGDMLEMGVFHGRSAALIGNRLGAGETLFLVDREDFLDRQAIAPFGSASQFILCPTEKLRVALPDFEGKKRSFRFIHIDAGHAYRPTINEFSIADELLSSNGIIALDDFTNLNYSQNMAAMFKYLFTASTDLTPFLVTDEKAYLCRRPQHAKYLKWLLDNIIPEMAAREIPDCILARSDSDPEYDAFYLRGRNPGETGNFYGIEMFKRFYRL